MRCPRWRLTLAFAALSLSSACSHKPPVPVDSYCLNYTEVIQEKGDGNIVAKPGPKRRILANELKYDSLCGPK
jgi:hypothetical protein